MGLFNVTTVVLALLFGLVLLLATSSCRMCGRAEAFRNPGEYNAGCHDDSRRHCMLSDGTPGKCVLNGRCVPSMMA